MEANVPPAPPQPPTAPPPGTPPAGDGYEKKFKVAAALAVVFGLAAIGLGIWGFSNKSDLDDANERIAQIESQDTSTLDAVKSKYLTIRKALSNRDVEVDDLESEVKKQSAELEQAKQATASADAGEEKEQAEANQLEKQLQLAQTCAQGAVSAIGKLLDEESAGTGTSGTIEKLQSLEEECKSAEASN